MRLAVDVSAWQPPGAIDWDQLADYGVDLAIIRWADYFHGTYEDGDLGRRTGVWFDHCDRAAAAGIALGSYLYVADQHDPGWQVERWVAAMQRQGGRFVVAAIDHESTAGPDPAGWVHRCQELVSSAGYRPWVYSGWSWSINVLRGRPEDRLWVAWYEAGHPEYRYPDASSLIDRAMSRWPDPWGRVGGFERVAAWQFTSSGYLPGYAGRLDLNVVQEWAWNELTGGLADAAPPAAPALPRFGMVRVPQLPGLAGEATWELDSATQARRWLRTAAEVEARGGWGAVLEVPAGLVDAWRVDGPDPTPPPEPPPPPPPPVGPPTAVTTCPTCCGTGTVPVLCLEPR